MAKSGKRERPHQVTFHPKGMAVRCSFRWVEPAMEHVIHILVTVPEVEQAKIERLHEGRSVGDMATLSLDDAAVLRVEGDTGVAERIRQLVELGVGAGWLRELARQDVRQDG